MKSFPEYVAVVTSVEAGAALHLAKAAVCLPLHDGWHGDLFCTLSVESNVACPACTRAAVAGSDIVRCPELQQK